MWMVRHADFTFSRPIPEPLLISRIEAGELERHDEICVSGGYWFSIQDTVEIRRFFGEVKLVEVLVPGSGEEVTSSSEMTDPERIKLEAIPAPVPSPEPASSKTANPLVRSGAVAPLEKSPAAPVKIELPDPDAAASPSAQILFVLALLAIFLGTIALLWLASK
jgi:hypothetical protein